MTKESLEEGKRLLAKIDVCTSVMNACGKVRNQRGGDPINVELTGPGLRIKTCDMDIDISRKTINFIYNENKALRESLEKRLEEL